MTKAKTTGPVDLWRKVFTRRTWGNLRFLDLTPLAQRLYFLITTGPQTNRVGYFVMSPAGAAELLKCDPAEVEAELNRLCTLFRWRYDKANRILWMRGWWDDYTSYSSNESAIRGAVKDLIPLPLSPLLRSFIAAGVGDMEQDRFEMIVNETLGTWPEEHGPEDWEGMAEGVADGASHPDEQPGGPSDLHPDEHAAGGREPQRVPHASLHPGTDDGPDRDRDATRSEDRQMYSEQRPQAQSRPPATVRPMKKHAAIGRD